MSEAVDQAKKLIASMTNAEKARIRQFVLRDLGNTFPGIESRLSVCGADPCIARTRIPVWALEKLRRQGASDEQILRAYPTLWPEDLSSAWEFVRANPAEIDRAIRDNEDA